MTVADTKAATERQRGRSRSAAVSKKRKSAAPSAPFRLTLFGHFELIGPDGPIDLGARKLCGLLAVLACSPAPQPREHLMAMLWGSHFDAQARQNLRKSLSRIRHALGEHVLVNTEDSIALRPGAIDSDVARFEALIADGSYDALVAAAACNRGPLLSDVSVSEEAWADWASTQRRRLEDRLMDALMRVAGEEEKQGQFGRALDLAKRAIAADPLREDAQRTIIRSLAAAGRRGEALKHYEAFAALLKRDLAVEPDAATRSLAAALRKPQPAPAADAAGEPPAPVLALPDRPSIAVLPFINMTGEAEQDYFSDGIVEDILAALSRERWLFVIARQSSFSYRGRAVDMKQVGRELGVRYVVEGSVRKAGQRVRINAQLIDTETDAHIWADRYEGDLTDIFALQDEITERIVTAVAPNIRSIEIKRALAKPTDNATAYDLYLRALHAFHLQDEEGIAGAEALLRRAIELDPDYAEALGTLTDCIASRTLNGWHDSVERGAAEACELARRALAAGPDNSTCVASAAFAYAALGRRFEEALELAERALALHPNSALVRNRAGVVYGISGESDKAVAQFEAAQRMNPRDTKSSTFALTGIAGAHFFARRFEDAVHWGRRAIALAPAANVARRCVAAALAHLGRLDEARAEIAALLEHQPNASLARSSLSSFRHAWMYELYLGGLGKAGLPER